eukprot:3313172-Lingulodinium_polyedra.AAC.1
MGGLDVGSLAARATAGSLVPRSGAGPSSPHRHAPRAAMCATIVCAWTLASHTCAHRARMH